MNPPWLQKRTWRVMWYLIPAPTRPQPHAPVQPSLLPNECHGSCIPVASTSLHAIHHYDHAGVCYIQPCMWPLNHIQKRRTLVSQLHPYLVLVNHSYKPIPHTAKTRGRPACCPCLTQLTTAAEVQGWLPCTARAMNSTSCYVTYRAGQHHISSSGTQHWL
jgi:hypothetical protein